MKNNCQIIVTTREKLLCRAHTGRSAWDRGVAVYALDLLTTLEEVEEGGNLPPLPISWACYKSLLLRGATDWLHYNESGNALAYDADIAARLCTPWELEKTENGLKPLNSKETWLAVQARALHQASRRLYRAINDVAEELDSTTASWRGQTVRAVAYDCTDYYHPLVIATLPGTDSMTETVLAWEYGVDNPSPRGHKVYYTAAGDAYIVRGKRRYRFDNFLRF